MARDIFLAERLAERGVYQLRGALPARLLFRLPGKLTAAEREPRLREPLREVRRGPIEEVERHPGLEDLDRGIGKDLRQPWKCGVLSNDNTLGIPHLGGGEPH